MQLEGKGGGDPWGPAYFIECFLTSLDNYFLQGWMDPFGVRGQTNRLVRVGRAGAVYAPSLGFCPSHFRYLLHRNLLATRYSPAPASITSSHKLSYYILVVNASRLS